MKIKEKMPGWQKGTLLAIVGYTILLLIFVNENKKNEVKKTYNFQDSWICYQKREKDINIMHLEINPFFILENKNKLENYEIIEDKKNYSQYSINRENKKFADITEIKKNRIEYKKVNEIPYICKRSSKFNHINDFTGKWVGNLNYGKDTPLTEELKDESKIIITLYKDGVFFTGENLPLDYQYQKVQYLKQSEGEFKLKMYKLTKDLPELEFKIISSKEIILKPSEINNKETYLKRIDKF